MSLKEKIIQYIASDRRRKIEVPEFGETIYATPVTVLDMEKILSYPEAATNSRDYHIYTIIEKAEDEKGQKIFSPEDKPYLEKMDWAIISRISNDIQEVITPDEAKKNS